MTTRVLAAACFLACLLLAPATSSATPYDEADSALRQHLVDAYEELGQWCVKKQLFLARDELAEVIIQLRPDHKRARGWLKYRKARDGKQWTPCRGADGYWRPRQLGQTQLVRFVEGNYRPPRIVDDPTQ